jgi:hypothetical protein
MPNSVLPVATPVAILAEKMDALAEVFGEKYAEGFDDPVVFVWRTFMSPAVKQFYKRDYPLISRTLFVESVYRRRPMYNQEVLDSFSGLVAKKLTDVLTLLSNQAARIRKLCETYGALTDADYLHPIRKLIPVIANHAKSYISVLEQLDQVYQLTGSATLNGVIDSNQRKNFELLSRKAVRAFSAMLRNEILKLRKESQRMRAASNASDTEMDHAEAAQTNAIAEFDQSNTNDAAIGDASVVDHEQGAEVLDNILATSTAAERRTTKKKPEVDPVTVNTSSLLVA